MSVTRQTNILSSVVILLAGCGGSTERAVEHPNGPANAQATGDELVALSPTITRIATAGESFALSTAVPIAAFQALPDWNGQDANVPLGMSEALQVAQRWLTDKGIRDASLRSAALRAAQHGKVYRYVYALEYEVAGDIPGGVAVIPGVRDSEPSLLPLVVTLDGKIVEARKADAGVTITHEVEGRVP